MSDDGFLSDIEEPNMAIRIKTLLGTSFDMKVSSTDTIGDIKRRIYRIEGKILDSLFRFKFGSYDSIRRWLKLGDWVVYVDIVMPKTQNIFVDNLLGTLEIWHVEVG